MSTIVLAYSGGLDTSVLLKQFVLAGHDTVALTADLGESDACSPSGLHGGPSPGLDDVRRKALALGARDAVLVDVKQRFIDDYAWPAMRANALYQATYPLSAALSRPLIASLLVETAHATGASAVAHGCTGKGNDQVRIEAGVRTLDPALRVLAPLRERPLSRPDAMAYAKEHGVPVSSTAEKPYSVDANLWGRSIEAGVLEDPWAAPPDDAFAWTAAPADRPAEPDDVIIAFEHGVPSCDGVRGAALVAQLNVCAGAHGVGRIDLIEDRVVGLKSREVYECPGSLTLIAAHRALERLVLTRDELRLKATLDQKYSELIYDGLWTSPLRTALDAFNGTLAERMTGRVRVRLHAGSVAVSGCSSPYALYDRGLATYGREDRFRHDAASGFIDLWSLPLEVAARVRAQRRGVTA